MTRWTLTHRHVMIFSNSTGVMWWLINSKYSKSEFWCLFPSFPRTAVTSAILCASWRPALQVANFMLIHATCSSNEKTYDQCLRKRFIKSSSWPSRSGHALGAFWRIAIFKLRWVPVKHIQKIAYSKRILLVFLILMSISEGASGFPHLPWSSLIWFGHELVYKPRLLLRSTIKPYFIW